MKPVFCLALCVMLVFAGVVQAAEPDPQRSQEDPKHADWRFGVGVTYMSGFQDVSDFYAGAYDLDVTVIPVGASFNATYQIPHGDLIASIPSAGIGPMGLIYVKETYYDYEYSYGSSTWFVDIPITATYGVKFFPHGSVGPYVRGGLAYHIASGDEVNFSSPGIFAAGGIEFLQKKRVSLAVEAAYDDSTVTFKDYYSLLGTSPRSKIKTGATLLSFRIVF